MLSSLTYHGKLAGFQLPRQTGEGEASLMCNDISRRTSKIHPTFIRGYNILHYVMLNSPICNAIYVLTSGSVRPGKLVSWCEEHIIESQDIPTNSFNLSSSMASSMLPLR
jgi:hypothetical protein